MRAASHPTISIMHDPVDGASYTADAVVVGSGAGGAAVAGELSRQGLSVLLLEAGELDAGLPFGSHAHTSFPNESQLESDYGPAVWSRLGPFQRSARPIAGLPGAASIHAVGGLLSFWSHMCARPDLDLEGEPTIPKAEMSALWDRAMSLLWANVSIESAGIRQGRIQRALAELYPDLPRGRGVQPLPTAMRRTASGNIEWAGIGALLDPGDASSPGTITVIAGFPARRIELTGERATGVHASDWRGRTSISVSGASIVSAGGAIGAAQLLHTSGVRPPALGRYLTDHTMITSRAKLSDEILSDVPQDDPTFSVWVPTSAARPIHTQLARGWVAAAPFVGELDHRQTVDIAQFAGVDPDPDNRLGFDDEDLDDWGMPRVSARFRLGDADRERVRFALADHHTILTAVADHSVGVSISIAPPGTSLHVMGTTRFGSDPESSTADGVGKVWGTDNVYVAGNGVISTLNAGNPTMNTVALGLRTARAIADGGSA